MFSKQEVRRPRAVGRCEDQAAFDLWREEFNTVRPHEHLGMARPADVYRPSKRSYRGTPESIDDGGMDTRNVHRQLGTIVIGGEIIPICQALGGWNVELNPAPGGELEVWFAKLLLGHVAPPRQRRSAPYDPVIESKMAAAELLFGLLRYAPKARRRSTLTKEL